MLAFHMRRFRTENLVAELRQAIQKLYGLGSISLSHIANTPDGI
jgi:hypothetical protein